MDEKFVEKESPKMYKESPSQLVAHLSHKNFWWRLTAQKLIVLSQDKSVAAKILQNKDITRSFWSLVEQTVYVQFTKPALWPLCIETALIDVYRNLGKWCIWAFVRSAAFGWVLSLDKVS